MSDSDTDDTALVDGWARFGSFVHMLRTRYDWTQSHVATYLNQVTRRERGYQQGEISAYERGDRLNPEVVRDYIVAFHLDSNDVMTLLVGVEDEDALEQHGDSAFSSVVDADPTLDDEAKLHMKRQYIFLQRASRRGRGGGGGGGTTSLAAVVAQLTNQTLIDKLLLS